jgi:phage gp29-like protein
MGIGKRIVNAIRGRGQVVRRPRPGQVVKSEALDTWREYPADGLTPAKLVSILRSADEGVVGQAMALYEQMEEKDAHLYCVATTRRLAVTGLRWQVISAADVRDGVDRAAADEAADYAREVLGKIEGFDTALQHLSLALGRNIAVAENVWEPRGRELRLVDVVPVPFERLTFSAAGEARVLTKQEPVDGIALPPDKFVLYAPQAVSGHPMRGGLLRVTALAYLGKRFALKDWMIFAEVFGMPLRIARYEPSATPEEKRELLRMLESLGADAAGIFSKAVELELLEANRGTAPPPYENICNFMNREMSKAWLGETLTVETAGVTGTFATAQIHNEVRLDLRQDDIMREGRVIRRDVLAPITRMQFGSGVPAPYFRRQFDPPRDLRELAGVLSTAVNELGMRVPARWAHSALGVPEAVGEEETLSGK